MDREDTLREMIKVYKEIRDRNNLDPELKKLYNELITNAEEELNDPRTTN